MFGLKRSASLIVGILALGLSEHAFAAEPDPPDLWKLVAQSHFIVEGVLDVPVTEIRLAAQSKKHRYVELGLAVEQVLKGELKERSLVIRFYTRPDPFGPAPKAVTDLTGKRVMVCLIRSDEPGCEGYYFAGDTPAALQASKPEAIGRTKQEIREQRQILEAFDKNFRPEQERVYPKVQQLIAATADSKKQQWAFRELQALGQDAVASMIMLMDDRRPLPVEKITLKNPPGHWEAVRHYRPEVVGDALNAILNQITGESFGPIHGGASETERQATVSGWRIYLHHTQKRGQP